MRKPLLIAALLLVGCNVVDPPLIEGFSGRAIAQTAYLRGSSYIGDTWIYALNGAGHYSADSVAYLNEPTLPGLWKKIILQIKPLNLGVATITDAQLWVTIDTYPESGVDWVCHRILQPVVFNAVTWDKYDGDSLPWDSLGCGTAGVDYEADTLATGDLATSAPGDSINVAEADNANFVTTLNNRQSETWYLIVLSHQTTGEEAVMKTTDAAVSTTHPRLIITYEGTTTGGASHWWWGSD